MMVIKNQGYVPGSLPGAYPAKKPVSALDPAHRAEANTAKLNQISTAPKMDTIEISGQHPGEHLSLANVKEQIISSLNQEKDPEALNALKEKVGSGAYRVDPGELARILLTGRNG